MATTTLIAGWTTAQVTKNRLHEFFGRQADQIANTFYTDMVNNVSILQGVRGLWKVQGKFDYVSFSTYIKSLTSNQEHIPGFSGYLYAAALPKSQIKQKEIEIINEKMIPAIYRNFAIKSDLKDEPIYPVLYVEPTGGRERALGLDFAGLPQRKKAIEYARDNNALATTTAVTLRTTGKPGFFFFLPLYKDGLEPDQLGERRDMFRGVVGVAFRSLTAFEQIYGKGDPYPLIDFKIYQGESQDEERLLYHHDPNFVTSKAIFDTVRTVRLQGQAWTVVVYAKPSLALGEPESRLPLYVFLGGALATVGVAIYFVIRLVGDAKN
ncbi:MAG: CHASE domain-containing protein [Microgenomates group bacterium]